MNRSRLDAESVRDAVLQISGSLDNKMGGPSVKQFIQTPGPHVTPIVDYINFDVDNPANCRRSVYRFIFRTLPDPFMDALDCPDASQLTPQRGTSVTACRRWRCSTTNSSSARANIWPTRFSQSGGCAAQVAQMFHLILGRDPTVQEDEAVSAYAKQARFGERLSLSLEYQ